MNTWKGSVVTNPDRNERKRLVKKLGGQEREHGRHTTVQTDIGDLPIVFGLSRGPRLKTGRLPNQLRIPLRDVGLRNPVRRHWLDQQDGEIYTEFRGRIDRELEARGFGVSR